MSEVLSRGGVTLLKREKASLVAATGLIFERLKETSHDISLQDSLVSYKGGTWGDESVEGVGYPVLRSSNMRGKRVDVSEAAWCIIPDKQAEAFSLQSGDILVTKSSGSVDLVGKAALFNDPNDGNLYLFSNFTMRLRPDRKKVIPEYLAWFLRSPQALSWRFENQQTTVGLRNLQTKEYLSQVIPVPSLEIQKQVADYLNAVEIESKESKTTKLPEILEEQRHVVERLEALTACIAKAQSLREEAGIEAESFISHSLKHLLKPKENWETKAIAEVSTMSTGTTPPSHQLDYYGGNILWYTPGDLGLHKELGKSTRTLSELAVQDKKARIFQPGTILLVAIGGSIGKVGLTRIECSSNQQITGILFHPEIFPDYGFWWMRRLYDEIRAIAPQATLPIINQQGIGRFDISYPSLDEQKQIVAYLDGLQAQQAQLLILQEETQKELDALLPSILNRAFNGEL